MQAKVNSMVQQAMQKGQAAENWAEPKISALDIMIEDYNLVLNGVVLAAGIGLFVWLNMYNESTYVGWNLGNNKDYSWFALAAAIATAANIANNWSCASSQAAGEE